MLSKIEVANERLPIRESLKREMDLAWSRLASAGTWWSGAERLAIAAEARHALDCDLCRQRKKSLSPYAMNGEHDTLDELPDGVVEAIHRLVTDAGRITNNWLRSLDIEETHYVEIIGVIAVLTGLDTLHRALGQPLHSLPDPNSRRTHAIQTLWRQEQSCLGRDPGARRCWDKGSKSLSCAWRQEYTQGTEPGAPGSL